MKISGFVDESVGTSEAEFQVIFMCLSEFIVNIVKPVKVMRFWDYEFCDSEMYEYSHPEYKKTCSRLKAKPQ